MLMCCVSRASSEMSKQYIVDQLKVLFASDQIFKGEQDVAVATPLLHQIYD